MRVYQQWMPPGSDTAVNITVGKMRSLVNNAAITPQCRNRATEIVRYVNPHDGTAQAQAIRDWCEDHIVFLRDPTGVELLHDPLYMLRLIDGMGEVHVDCDDAAMLSAALGKTIGLLAEFVLVGFRSPSAPFSHVWTELRSPTGGPWVEQDVTRAAQRLPSIESRVKRVRV